MLYFFLKKKVRRYFIGIYPRPPPDSLVDGSTSPWPHVSAPACLFPLTGRITANALISINNFFLAEKTLVGLAGLNEVNDMMSPLMLGARCQWGLPVVLRDMVLRGHVCGYQFDDVDITSRTHSS